MLQNALLSPFSNENSTLPTQPTLVYVRGSSIHKWFLRRWTNYEMPIYRSTSYFYVSVSIFPLLARVSCVLLCPCLCWVPLVPRLQHVRTTQDRAFLLYLCVQCT